jgi:hypothetical protein
VQTGPDPELPGSVDSSNTFLFPRDWIMLSSQTLEAFLKRCSGAGVLGRGDIESVLLEALTATILPPNPQNEWRRRPSLCHDGTPAQVSLKLSHCQSGALRVLVEPGSMAMTVAQQISFSLNALDEMLGDLSWRTAVYDVNAITHAVLPEDEQETRKWWGGIWLGVAVFPASVDARPPAELRVYINLRNGTASVRWRRLAELFSYFRHHDSKVFEEWSANLAPHTTPVGLGIVIAKGQVAAIRIYVAAKSNEAEFVRYCEPMSLEGKAMLVGAFSSFTNQLGPSPSGTVTIGFDFMRDDAGMFLKCIGRVKVELSCQGVVQNLRPYVVPWIEGLLEDWSLDISRLRNFTADIDAAWGGFDIEHVSLGFTPTPEHVTVYVKPWS